MIPTVRSLNAGLSSVTFVSSWKVSVEIHEEVDPYSYDQTLVDLVEVFVSDRSVAIGLAHRQISRLMALYHGTNFSAHATVVETPIFVDTLSEDGQPATPLVLEYRDTHHPHPDLSPAAFAVSDLVGIK